MDDPQPSISSDNASSSDNMLATNQRRQCWVCLHEQEDSQGQDLAWICPCTCKGSMKWVHEECLQRWIDEKQKRPTSNQVSCSQCKTTYIISFPPTNTLVRLLEKYDKLLYKSSPVVAVSVVLGSIYLCCASYGFISITQVMGYDEGRRFIDEADPPLLIIGLPIIPITLVLTKLIRWEEFLLKLWRRSAYNIPRPLSYIIDKPPAKPRPNCEQILLDPGFNDPFGCTRLICGALLLPSVSTLIGKIFFSTVTQSKWRRSLIGGIAFLIVKGALKIYLRKSQYITYSQRKIGNYDPSTKSSNDTTGSGRDPNDAGYSTGTDNNADRTSILRHLEARMMGLSSDEDDVDGESDSEEQTPRPRPVFSMTISLGG